MVESNLGLIVARIIKASGKELLKTPEGEPRAFDFGFQHYDKRIAIEVKMRETVQGYALLGDRVRIAREGGYDEIWLVTPEIPEAFFAAKEKDSGTSKFTRWLSLAQFADELHVPITARDIMMLRASDDSASTANSNNAGAPSGQKLGQRPRRNKELQGLLLLEVRDGVKHARLKDFSEADQIYNSALLVRDGLAEGDVIRDGEGRYVAAAMTELTTAGHDYLEQNTTEESIEKPEGVSATAGVNLPADVPKGGTTQRMTSDNVIQVGGRTYFSRTAAGDEIVLGVKEYANVLTKLLENADDKDLCLAIFGPWGRGKTFLIEQTIAKLTGAYKVVKFSAWKYPSRPEVWINLYETFFAIRAKEGWFRSLAFTILSGIKRHGSGKLWLAWATLMLTAIPKAWFINGIVKYFSKFEFAIALASVVFIVIFVFEFWTTTFRLRRSYFSGTRHFEKLGLQGTIGGDLKAFLLGWVQVDFKNKKIRRGLRLFYTAAVALIAFILWRSHEALLVAAALSGVVTVAALLVGFAFKFSAHAPAKVLLVVDDLDRCQFDHLLVVMESIKLLLEDDEISKRVQVVMLIEEDILKHAIWEKYKTLVESNAQKALGTLYNDKRIIRDSFEKLFTAHLRLGSLKPSDIADIVFGFGGRVVNKSSLSGDAVGSFRERDINTSGRSSDNPGQPVDQLKSAELCRHECDSNVTISTHEKQVILAAISQVYTGKESELGPRALRAIMFRYQLARLLLAELKEENWRPALLARMIVQRHSDGSIGFEDGQRDAEVLKRVAEQVA